MTPGELELTVQPGGRARGSFRLSTPHGEKFRGFLYSSSPRMLFEPAEFQGADVEIRCQIDASGMSGGMTEESCFTICSDLGEYTLPCHIFVSEQEEQPGEAPADDLKSLTELAGKDYQRAYRFFLSEKFAETSMLADSAKKALYEGLRPSSAGYQGLEEFLDGVGTKQPVQLQADQRKTSFHDVTEPVMETVGLTRNGWGFVRITADSDTPFLRVEKTLFSTDDFMGSTYELRYLIDPRKMHAGTNYGRITVSTSFQTIEIEVTAGRKTDRTRLHQNTVRKKMRCKLENLYIGFRLQKMDTEAWIERSTKAISNYTGAGGENPFADLFLIQLHYAAGRRQKALKILNSLQEHQERFHDETSYGFYLYLTTFFAQDSAYVDEIEGRITQLLAQDPSNWVFQWILLYLNETLLSDDGAKYEAVAVQFERGCRSRIMYLEAYQILQRNPFFMHHIGTFELQILRFAMKEQVLTEGVLLQAAELSAHVSEYQDLLFEILAEGYRQFPSKELLQVICQLLMKGENKDDASFPWYEKAVGEGLRITGLYEYYMASMPYTKMSDLPQIIQMYFSYDHLLDYRRRAVLYASVYRQRETDPQMYRTHRAAMQKFTQEQLEAGHLTEALAELYRGLLRKDMLTRQTAEKLLRMMSTWEVACQDTRIRHVVIHAPGLEDETIVPLIDGKAQIQIYDPETAVLLADEAGTRHPAALLGELHPVFEDETLLQWCLEKQPESVGALLYVSSRSLMRQESTRSELFFLQKAVLHGCFTPEYRRQMRARILAYYQSHLLDDTLQEYIRTIDIQAFAKADKTALIILLAEEGMCEQAFELLDRYGAEGIPLIQLVRICSRMVLACEFEENRMLLALCHTCFANGKYDDKLLRYLLLYYEGPVHEMVHIWKAGCEFELDTLMMEERILTMVLFMGSQTEETDPVFEAYQKKMGRRKLCRAYANLRSYEYFVKGYPVGMAVFQFVEHEYDVFLSRGKLQDQEDVCRLALLQYYSGRPSLDDRQEKRTEQLLEEYNRKGMRFAFWKKFPAHLLAPYQMEGREFVEYVCSPKHEVMICYRKKSTDAYKNEVVRNYFEGIFVREFTLFAGEELEYYLEEQSEHGVKRTELCLLTSGWEESGGYTQYELLNRILHAKDCGDEKALRQGLEDFLLQEYLAKELFTLI